MDGRILIVDGIATNRIVLKMRLTSGYYDPILAADAATALMQARLAQPDVILIGQGLADADPLRLIAALKSDPATRAIPVLALRGPAPSARAADERLAALQAGADDVLDRPVDDGLMLARLRNLMRGNDTAEALAPLSGLAETQAPFHAAGHIALVAERADAALRLRHRISALLADRLSVLTREEALVEGMAHAGTPPHSRPDVYVVMALADGRTPWPALLSEFRNRPNTRHGAVCVAFSTPVAPETLAMAYDLGADDVLTCDQSPAELALRLQRLVVRKRQGDRLRQTLQDGLRMAIIDPLTGLYNRRYALPQLAAMSAAADAAGGTWGVLAIDIDRFKRVNDGWGHKAGDAVLVAVAGRLQRALRGGDMLARVGGEEFLAGLPRATPSEARAIAQELCHAIDAAPFDLPGGQQLHVTVSIGVASGRASAQNLLDAADTALFASKSAGRNTVTDSLSAA